MNLGEIGEIYGRLQLDMALESATLGAPDLTARVQKLRMTTVPAVQNVSSLGELRAAHTTSQLF